MCVAYTCLPDSLCKSISSYHPLTRNISTNSWEICKNLKHGHLCEALRVLDNLEYENYNDRSYTYVCILQGCIQSDSLNEGRLLHNHLIKSGWKLNVYISTALVNMYARCGNIEDAQVAFSNMPERNLVTWNMMISAYSNYGRFEEALSAFWGLQKEGLKPDDVSFVSALRACAGLGSLHNGEKIHGLLKSSLIKATILIDNSLIHMYARCESMENAQQVFDEMEETVACSWNTMIAGYVKKGEVKEALRIFSKMLSTCVKPDEVTYLIISNACAILKDLKQAKVIHEKIRSDIVSNTMLWNSLIDMYAKCGSLNDAQELFYQVAERDISTWNALFGGYTNQGCCEEAFVYYERMKLEGFFPNHFSFVLILTACTTLQDLVRGKQVHSQIPKSGMSVNVFVENALVDMYAKCGSLLNARIVFNQMSARNVISWNTMLGGYVKHGFDFEVFKVFEKMESEGMKPDQATYVSLLNACASLAALEQGLKVHNGIIVSYLECDLFIGNALIDLYAKCGRIKDACKVLDRMWERDVVSWNTILAGYGQHGLGYEALDLAGRMLNDGANFNHASFVGVLTACSHAGLMDEGWFYFSRMTHLCGVKQEVEHYGCMIDLLGRAGQLHEAEELLRRLPLEASALSSRALLGACRTHGNLAIAVRAAERILDLEPEDTAALLLVSTVYAWADGFDNDAMVSTIKEISYERKLQFQSMWHVFD
ncbi:hypothetical protein L7F22_038350 [Adiantum nelumboides]|nr:hypothetical protein [Adiantum nelumboides]